MKITVSKSQADILKHSLDVWDALSEVFEDENLSCDAEDTQKACELLLEGLSSNTLDTQPAEEATSKELVAEILIECVIGSTWWACHKSDPDVTALQLANIVRAGKALAKTLTRAFDLDETIEFPCY